MKNTVTVKITGYAPSMLHDVTNQPTCERSRNIQLERELTRIMRRARKIGDVETINHTMLGKLKNSGIQFTRNKTVSLT